MESWLTANARKILTDRYLRKDAEGRRETIEEWLARICAGVARACPSDETRAAGTVCARRLLESGRAILNTPALMSAGLARGQLAACFVLPIADDMGVDGAGIFATLRNAALIQQTGGGIGFDWSSLRPRGDRVASSGGSASGPVSFLGIYDRAFGAIAQGGCLLPDTLINTSSGLLRLDEIVDIGKTGWSDRGACDPVAVPTDDGMRAVIRKFNNGVAPILRITMENGSVIRGTHNHRIKMFSGDRIQWRAFSDLRVDDRIMIMIDQHHGRPQELAPLFGKINDTTIPTGFPLVFDEKLARVIGNMTYYAGFGDGIECVGSRDDGCNESRMLCDLFGTDDVKISSLDEDLEYAILHGANAMKILAALGILNKDGNVSRDHIPRIIRQSPRDVIIAYLQGFTAHNGDHIENGFVWFDNICEMSFALDLQVLLAGIGCLSRIEKGKSYDYKVMIYESVHGYFQETREICDGDDDDDDTDHLSNMRFLRVASITEEEPQLTLDLEVDDNHTYIANGMVVHNSRRGANMGVMRVDHPDIEQFIECKSHSETVLTSFNISIALTDEFMRAVANDSTFPLINPHGGKVSRTVRARELMRKIAQGAWVNGEPGVLFIDTINAENAMSHKYTIVATNPCGEQNLGPYENCCLGHVNLAWHCDPSDGSIDWARMRETVRDLVDVLNMVIDANYYIPAIPQLRERALAARRIGLGITGLADVFMLNEIAYGSPESVELAERIACFIRLVAMECSVELAQRDGAFPEFEGSSWSREEVRAEFVSRVARACARGIACTSDVALAQHIMEGIAECGIRNASILTVAPTGTTSLILGVEGYGCEPIFSLAYSRTLGDGSRMQFCSELARRVAARYVNGTGLESVCEEIRDKGCVTNCAAIPQIARDAIGATALRVAPAQHLAIQAALQRWVDSSISKTINCPNETTVEEVEKMYLDAWKLRLKGVAIYRSGSRTSEVLVAPAPAPAPVAVAPAVLPARSSEVHRPSYVCGGTYRCEASFGHVFTTVNTITDEDGIAPFEVFIAVGKSGSDIQADSEAIGRLISTILRLNSSVPPVERLGMVIAQLRNIGGSRGHRDSQTKTMIQSLPDAVAFSLSEVMKLWSARDVAHDISRDCDICPECGATALRRVERCKKCSECGYSAC